MTQKALDRYIGLKLEIEKLEEEMDGLKEKVIKFVSDSKDGKIETDNYMVRSSSRVSYEFSSEYEAKNKELKALRKSEIEEGVAVEKGKSNYVAVKIK